MDEEEVQEQPKEDKPKKKQLHFISRRAMIKYCREDDIHLTLESVIYLRGMFENKLHRILNKAIFLTKVKKKCFVSKEDIQNAQILLKQEQKARKNEKE